MKLSELRELLAKVSSGPWTSDMDYRFLDNADHALIIALRNNADKLLKVVEAARAYVEEASLANASLSRVNYYWAALAAALAELERE